MVVTAAALLATTRTSRHQHGRAGSDCRGDLLGQMLSLRDGRPSAWSMHMVSNPIQPALSACST
jgi:hypothetical protein